MKVELLHNTPLWICSQAIRTCWDSHDKSDTITPAHMEDGYGLSCGDKDKELIQRVGNKYKHESVKNHINYTFEISGISTKTLLALTRHDIGVEFSVQSTRYTTKKTIKNETSSYTESKDDYINECLKTLFDMIVEGAKRNVANDELSLLLPQAWNYNLVCTMSMSALQNFLKLRTKKDAHWNIRELAYEIIKEIPEEHMYMFEDYIHED